MVNYQVELDDRNHHFNFLSGGIIVLNIYSDELYEVDPNIIVVKIFLLDPYNLFSILVLGICKIGIEKINLEIGNLGILF